MPDKWCALRIRCSQGRGKGGNTLITQYSKAGQIFSAKIIRRISAQKVVNNKCAATPAPPPTKAQVWSQSKSTEA